MKLKMTLLVDTDDEAMADHDGDQAPPPNEVAEWDGRDVFVAYDLGLLETYDAEMIEISVVEEHEG